MPDHELLVIGGGPAGLAAARGYRDTGGEGRVAIVTDEHRMPYRRPPLTKELMRDEIDEDELALEDEAWLEERAGTLISDERAPDDGAIPVDAGMRLIAEGARWA